MDQGKLHQVRDRASELTVDLINLLESVSPDLRRELLEEFLDHLLEVIPDLDAPPEPPKNYRVDPDPTAPRWPQQV